MRKHDDLTVIDCGWNPPKDWKFGVCQDCQTSFQPALPKQYYCHDCRMNGSIYQEILDTKVCGLPKSNFYNDKPVGILLQAGWSYKQTKNDEVGFWKDPMTRQWVSTDQALFSQKAREAKREPRHTLP